MVLFIFYVLCVVFAIVACKSYMATKLEVKKEEPAKEEPETLLVDSVFKEDSLFMFREK